MRRILSFLLVALLVVTLAVPTFASETYVLYGRWEFPENITYNMDTYDIVEVPFTSEAYYYGWCTDFVKIDISNYGGSPKIYLYTATGSDFKVYEYGQIYNDWNRIIDFGTNRVVVEKQTYDFFHNNAVLTNAQDFLCDGSTCPATDLNFDDICDDCGQTLAYNLRQSPKTYEIVVKHSADLTILYRYTETLANTAFAATYNDERITVTFTNPVNHNQYKLVDGQWVDSASYPNTSGSHVISLSGSAAIVSSDLSVYDSNGDLFFQNPLWMAILGVTQGGMEQLTAETSGTMKVLVVCGVGLIALLVVLNLFGKRSLIFRG